MILINPYSVTAGGGGGGGYVVTDADAIAFLSATSITDSTISEAIDELVIALKAASVWTKFYAIYPYVGGTATTHKYNLKDPQDLDASYRVTWNGSPTHNANGVTGNGGSSAYGDTHLSQSTVIGNDNEHVSCYSRTDLNVFTYAIATSDGSLGGGTLLMERLGGNFYSQSQNTTSDHTVASADSLGYFSLNRTSGADYNKRHNSTNTTITDSTGGSPVKQVRNFFLMAGNSGGSPARISDRNYAWHAIGQGLTSTEDGDVRTAVQDFQTTLSRQV